MPDTPYGGGLAEFRLDTSSLCSSRSNASEKVQAASQSRGGPRLAVLVLAPMRCLKPGPSGFAAGRSPLCVHISFPSQTAGALHPCPLGLLPTGWGSGHGCIPCWRTSHPAADLKRSRKLRLPVVGRWLHSRPGLWPCGLQSLPLLPPASPSSLLPPPCPSSLPPPPCSLLPPPRPHLVPPPSPCSHSFPMPMEYVFLVKNEKEPKYQHDLFGQALRPLSGSEEMYTKH